MYCEICGNEIGRGATVCGFCGSAQQGEVGPGPRPFQHRTVNLEAGKPFVEQALAHLRVALDEAKRLDLQMLTVIHGYGSSGRGGAIRTESRKLLDYLLARGEVRAVIDGEKFQKRNGVVRDLLRRFPALGQHPDLNRSNRGITLVLLK